MIKHFNFRIISSSLQFCQIIGGSLKIVVGLVLLSKVVVNKCLLFTVYNSSENMC